MDQLNALWIIVGIAVLVAGPGGATWMVNRVSMNGIREDVQEIKDDLKEFVKTQSEMNASCLRDRTELRADLRNAREWVGSLSERLERRREPRDGS